MIIGLPGEGRLEKKEKISPAFVCVECRREVLYRRGVRQFPRWGALYTPWRGVSFRVVARSWRFSQLISRSRSLDLLIRSKVDQSTDGRFGGSAGAASVIGEAWRADLRIGSRSMACDALVDSVRIVDASESRFDALSAGSD